MDRAIEKQTTGLQIVEFYTKYCTSLMGYEHCALGLGVQRGRREAQSLLPGGDIWDAGKREV